METTAATCETDCYLSVPAHPPTVRGCAGTSVQQTYETFRVPDCRIGVPESMTTIKSVFTLSRCTETMAIDQETEMTDAAIDQFLARHETGVLSLARTDDPYAIPISYGYDDENRVFYMRLVSTPESEKRQFLDAAPSARLVIYDEQDSSYRSVIATGTLENIPPAELTAEQIAQYGDARRPLFEIWAQQKDELDIELYRLTPDSINGRRTDIDRGE